MSMSMYSVDGMGMAGMRVRVREGGGRDPYGLLGPRLLGTSLPSPDLYLPRYSTCTVRMGHVG